MTKQFELQPWDCKPVKYTSLGAYPVFYLARTGYRNDETGELEFSQYDRSEFVCCPDCLANPSNEAIAIAADANWEDSQLYCGICSERIESAYAEKD